MNDRTRFAKGMLALSLTLKMYGRELSDPMQEAYWLALGDLTDDEFEQAAAVLLRRETDFPPPALFLEIARPQPDLGAEAYRVMCRAMLTTGYDPEGGTTWSGAQIRDELGEAAYQAFHACGGASGFRDADSPYHGARIRRDFCDTYRRLVTSEPRTALPSGNRSDLTPAKFLALVRGIGNSPVAPAPAGESQNNV